MQGRGEAGRQTGVPPGLRQRPRQAVQAYPQEGAEEGEYLLDFFL